MLNKQRKTIRLRGYDYSSDGWYYVTICTFERRLFFGEIKNGKMVLNKYGEIVLKIWQSLPHHHLVELDALQIMPNHIHGIIIIQNCRGLIYQTQNKWFGSWMGMINHAPTLGHIVRYFKAKVSKTIGMQIWQRNYYDHIIRNDKSLNEIRQYIQLNPILWDRDRNNPENLA